MAEPVNVQFHIGQDNGEVIPTNQGLQPNVVSTSFVFDPANRNCIGRRRSGTP